MRRIVKLVFRTANVLAVILCVAWYAADPGFERIITGAIVLAGLCVPLGTPAPPQLLQLPLVRARFSEGQRYSSLRSRTQLMKPPFHKADVAKRYVGLMVRWNLFFWDANAREDGSIRVILDFGPRTTQLVYCVVQLKNYQELTVMRRGEPVSVEGVIGDVSSREVELSDVRLSFAQLSDAGDRQFIQVDAASRHP